MKRFLFLFILIFSFLCFSCISTNTSREVVQENVIQPPKWITDQGRFEVFPVSVYISQFAYGNTAQESKEKASTNISEYIKSSVKSSTSSSYFSQKSSNGFEEKKETKEEISISTNNNLYKIEYTNPFYDSELGQYACVAYINKEESFNFVKQKMEVAKNEFPTAYRKALEKESLLKKIIGIKQAQETLQAFYEVYDFARAISPEKSKIYEEVDFLANESYTKLNELTSSILIKIEGRGDIKILEEFGVITELASQFEKIGFRVGKSNKYNCLALVEVKCPIVQTNETFEAYPEISVKVIEKGEEQISYSKKLSKVAGFDRSTVLRRTNIALTNELKTSFVNECL